MNVVAQAVLDEVKRMLDDSPHLKQKGVKDVLLSVRFNDETHHWHTPGGAEEHEHVGTLFSAMQEYYKGAGRVAPVAKTIPLLTQAIGDKARAAVELLPVAPSQPNRKIIFHHGRAAGDALMFSAGVRDFKLLFPEIAVGVDNGEQWIWENNPYIDRSLKKGDAGVEYYEVGYPWGHIDFNGLHFTHLFFLDMVAIADLHHRLPISAGEFCAALVNGQIGDPSISDFDKNPHIAVEPFISIRRKYKKLGEKFLHQRGDLHLSAEEKSYNMIKDLYGIEKYWVIAPGGKRDATVKIWDWRKFQKVIDHFDGLIKFVMIGKGDLLVEPLRGVIDLVDKTNSLRDLVPLVYHSEGCVSGPSLLMHLSAAVPKIHDRNGHRPCVTILGGREPSGWTWYTGHQVLHTNGVFKCCENGGCWRSRVVPLPKDPDHNKNLCENTIKTGGRTIQACMEAITAEDIIRAIGKYYQGDLYSLGPAETVTAASGTDIILDTKSVREDGIRIGPVTVEAGSYLATVAATIEAGSYQKEINLLGNLNTQGGGEQSLVMIADLLGQAGWEVHLYPWGEVNDKFKGNGLAVEGVDFISDQGAKMAEVMRPGLPLLFYANDCVWDFPKYAQGIVEKSSMMIMGINYMLGHFKDPSISSWLSRSGKLKAVIFQNTEKEEEWRAQVPGFDGTKLHTLFGAIDLDRFLEVCPADWQNGSLVVLKHCVADGRKYVTKESVGKGKKLHVWQKHFDKELDTKFYSRLLKDTKRTRFEFMEAHHELVDFFKGESRMVFHKWDSMPVDEFLSRGQVYLYRTSNEWRDNYPRVVAEALAAGLPVITEPRDGTKDRVVYGDTGFYFADYDGALYALKTLQRKEKLWRAMSQSAKDWARKNLDPRRWVGLIEEVVHGNER